jgi:choline dehydrogenase
MRDSGLEWDYVVVGSGAGGGTLAARLVEAGMRVCVLEAGGDARRSETERLPDDYDVPGFHPFSCENPAMSWDFQVRHYDDEVQQSRDPKYDARRGGVCYPRGATLGGSTAHNAMIFMLPHESDWEGIAQLTGDDSWQASRMRKYVRRLEACDYQPLWRVLRYLGIDPTGHGWKGWLHTETPWDLKALKDGAMKRFLVESTTAFLQTLHHPGKRIRHWLFGLGDPNFRPRGARSFKGLCYTPLATQGHQRMGARERLRQAQAANPDRLHIELHALATRVLLDENGTARGVEYLEGERLYGAEGSYNATRGVRREVRVRREVILCGGAFNTPQLLMLSGIGPAAHLRAHGIPVRVDLPGVGSNLQDRYEVAVTHRMSRKWAFREGATFARGDPMWQRWKALRDGLYASNGTALSFIHKSAHDLPEPDIFCMALPARFEGYFPGFSHWIRDVPDALTWAILKAYTHNRAGSVTLQSADPRRPPRIDFHSFEEGSPGGERDLKALVGAIQQVRQLTEPLIEAGVIAQECAPGPHVADDVALAEYVRNTAWGHHACGSCAIGPQKDGGVTDSRFAVHGTRGLRVVDASVFPRIPGFFLASAVYLIAEKAADVLIETAAQIPPHTVKESAMPYTAPDLLKLSQQQLDDLFGASPPGDIPNGPSDGTAIISPGTVYSPEIAELINVFGWKGKVFDAAKGLLKNRILAFGVEAIVARVYKGASWFDGKDCIVLDYSDTSVIAHWVRDEIRLIGPGFYLGKVYWSNKPLIHFCLQF